MILRAYRAVLVPSLVPIRISRKATTIMQNSGSPDHPQRARSKLEENVARLEATFEPHLRAGIVGQTEGRQIAPTSGTLPGVAGAEPVPNPNPNPNPKTQNPGSQLDENVRKLEQSFDPETRAGIVGRTEGRESITHTDCVIQLASKGPAEAEYVEKLKQGAGLQLPDGVSLTAAPESSQTGWRGAFDVHAYLEELSTSQFGRLVLYSPLIPTTQTLLSQNFHSLPTGTVFVASAQLQGKGRGGNAWQSPEGCLMFSFTTRMTDGRMVPFLQYVVSLAVVEAVEEVCGVPAPDVRIKWPNDLYAEGVKIGGVLCTSTYRDKTFNIVVGVGLNVGNREPTTCLDALVEKLHGDGASPVQQEVLLAGIMEKFEGLNRTFQEEGFGPLREGYIEKWLHSGQSVVLEEGEPGSAGVSHVPVTIRGLTPMGFLLAEDDAGEQYELHPDGNSFDFLKGLVRQKLAV